MKYIDPSQGGKMPAEVRNLFRTTVVAEADKAKQDMHHKRFRSGAILYGPVRYNNTLYYTWDGYNQLHCVDFGYHYYIEDIRKKNLPND